MAMFDKTYSKTFRVRMCERELEMLDGLALLMGCTPSEVVRQLIATEYARIGAPHVVILNQEATDTSCSPPEITCGLVARTGIVCAWEKVEPVLKASQLVARNKNGWYFAKKTKQTARISKNLRKV